MALFNDVLWTMLQNFLMKNKIIVNITMKLEIKIQYFHLVVLMCN